jgi:diguanylate cyclase (GGDEF)-like protein
MKPEERSASKRHIRRLSLFHEMGQALASAGDSQEILRTMMAKIGGFYRPLKLSLLLLDEGPQELYPVVDPGSLAEEQGARLKLGEGIAGWVAKHGEPILVEDADSDPRFRDPLPDGLAGRGSVLCVPIKGREAVLGVIRLASGPTGDRLSKEEIPTLTVLADYIAIALEHARLTIADHCTGLFNARHLSYVLEAEIYRSTRFGHEFSVVFMDLDDFKKVNDAYGHLLGSKFLRMVGDLIKAQLRVIDSAFRYGGDEFVLLLPHTSKPNALVMVRRLREALNSGEFSLEKGRNLKMTASYGVASFPADARTAQDLLRLADEALYRVKSTTRDDIAVAGDDA